MRLGLSVGAGSVWVMVSNTHEVLAELFWQRPALAAELLSGPLGMPVPAFAEAEARMAPAELTERIPAEWRPEGVVVLTDAADVALMGVVVEIQRRRDPAKRLSWPVRGHGP
jgi:hypothetical protein